MKFLTMIISVIALSFGLQTAMAKSMEDQDAMLAFGSTAESEVIVLAAQEMDETTGAHLVKINHSVNHRRWHEGEHVGVYGGGRFLGPHNKRHRGAHNGPHYGKVSHSEVPGHHH